MSNESKAQAISGVIIGIGIISILLNITIWKSILVIAGIIIGTLIMAGVYVVLKMLAWTILDDIDEAKERRKEEERRHTQDTPATYTKRESTTVEDIRNITKEIEKKTNVG